MFAGKGVPRGQARGQTLTKGGARPLEGSDPYTTLVKGEGPPREERPFGTSRVIWTTGD